MAESIDVEAVNLTTRVALLTDGRTVPVTNIFDSAGDEIEGPDGAVSFVCGEGDLWITGWTESYREVPTQ